MYGLFLQAVCVCGGAFIGALAPFHIRAAFRTSTRWHRERQAARARALVRTSTYQAIYARDLAEAERSKSK